MWELFTAAVVIPSSRRRSGPRRLGEGMAPFYIAKAEITRAQGAPFILMVHVSSLLLFLRVMEIVISM